MSRKVESLGNWSPEAALASAREEIDEHGAEGLAIAWVDAGGEFRFLASGLTSERCTYLAARMQGLAIEDSDGD